MATPAHCTYCFEILIADLEDREPLEYRQVLDLWTQYEALTKSKPTETEEDDEDEHDPDLQGRDDLEEDSEMDGLEEADEDEDGEDDAPPEELAQHASSKLSLPSISRLQASSPASASSASSTPSSLSTTSSNAALDTTSKSSSKTSFFSFGSRRSQQPSPAPPLKEEEHPLFVTWNTISPRSGNKSLRGCIGTFEAQELEAGLRGYALTAAFDDHRFPAISLPELPTLSTSITLLTNFTPASHPLDWTLGTHGIRISFSHHGKRYSATYLPDVAVEQGWSKEETIVSLMRKAGWKGRSGEWRDVKGLGVVTYEGKKASLGWAEWRGWRSWVEGLRN
ncbi:hypothetical protein HO133_005018 [Letharia lupina]|uniref:AMMECR1 domain-containing protein n=1 Tax=Letharia lupina TaxID=560253 RepID=A0A8H6C906_9LECA|nr:uncharacterized protein HO133_005018 [Letharia lupina]KAF6219193.1 hypothetical protein HO133_005018 [Letharia lupina]